MSNIELLNQVLKSQNHYETLGLDSKDATQTDIRQAYKKMSFQTHPDKNQDHIKEATAAFKRIQEAFSVLSEETLRRKYDATLPSQALEDKFDNICTKKPDIDKDYFYHPEDKIISYTPTLVAGKIRGRRSYQEDMIAINKKLATLLLQLPDEAQKYIIKYVFEELQKKCKEYLFKGSTALVVATSKQKNKLKITTASLGDSSARAIIINVKTGKIIVIPLNKLQSVGDGSKRNRIWNSRIGLNLSGALGDSSLHTNPFFKTKPEIEQYEIEINEDEKVFIVAGSDGVFDYITDEELGKMFFLPGATTEQLVENLLRFLYCVKRSKDNISLSVTEEDSIMSIFDSHGGDAVSKKAAENIYLIMRNKIRAISLLSPEQLKKLLSEKNDSSELESSINDSREFKINQIKNIVSFSSFDLDNYRCLLVTNPFGFPGPRSFIIEVKAEENDKVPLLESLQSIVSLSGTSFSRYFYRTEKCHRIEIPIPLTKDLVNLPKQFDQLLDTLKTFIENKPTFLKEKKEEVKEEEIPQKKDLTHYNEFVAQYKSLKGEYKKLMRDSDPMSSLPKLKVIPPIQENQLFMQEVKKDALTITSSGSIVEKKNSTSYSLTVSQLPIIRAINTKALLCSNNKLFSTQTSSTFSGELVNTTNTQKVIFKFYEWIRYFDAVKPLKDMLGMLFLQDKLSPHYLKFIGLHLDPSLKGGLFIVTECMKLGSLENFLNIYYTEKSGPLPTKYLLKIALDIAYGLQGLHSINMSHNDLRSENIYLDEELHAKIGGFGNLILSSRDTNMSVGINNSCNYASFAPERFDSTEDEYPHFARDIYAFGLILRELWSKEDHRKAYAGIPQKYINDEIISGKQEVIPGDCPIDVATQMLACWSFDPKKRPSASQLVQFFEEKLKHYEQLEEKYSYNITQPKIFSIRTPGSKKEYRSTQFSSDRETLLHYLDVTHLATPQNCFFVLGTEYPSHLLKEFEVLMDNGLDSLENFNFIKNHLFQYGNTETPLMANLLTVLNNKNLLSDKDILESAEKILQLPEKKALLIQEILEHLSIKDLCTKENIDFMTKSHRFLKTARDQLLVKKTLTQSDLEQAFSTKKDDLEEKQSIKDSSQTSTEVIPLPKKAEKTTPVSLVQTPGVFFKLEEKPQTSLLTETPLNQTLTLKQKLVEFLQRKR